MVEYVWNEYLVEFERHGRRVTEPRKYLDVVGEPRRRVGDSVKVSVNTESRLGIIMGIPTWERKRLEKSLHNYRESLKAVQGMYDRAVEAKDGHLAPYYRKKIVRIQKVIKDLTDMTKYSKESAEKSP